MGSRNVTRAEAATVIARHVVLNCIRENTRLTLDMIEREIAQWAGHAHPGTFGEQWTKLAAPSTAYRLAITNLIGQGREDLLPPEQPNSTQRRFLRDLVDAGGEGVFLDMIRLVPATGTVVICRERGWVARYAGLVPHDGGHLHLAPWSITDEGLDAMNKAGAYRRTTRRLT